MVFCCAARQLAIFTLFCLANSPPSLPMAASLLQRLTRVLCEPTGMAHVACMICVTHKSWEPEIPNSNKKANLKPP